MALAQLAGYFLAAYLVERWGRRPTLALYLCLSGLFTLLFGLAARLGWILAAAICMSFFTLGAWGALYAYTPELYPTEIRGTGMGWAGSMTRIAGALAPITGGFLLPISLMAALAVYGLAFVAGGVTVFALGLETRQQPLLDTVADHSRKSGRMK
jgi:MFS transporter, putative metabolite:H+ symporter